MSTAVIITTYNSPEALRKSLLGFTCQTDQDFEVVIADDGSDERTSEVLALPALQGLRLAHVWQEDRGYRRSRIVNAAIRATQAEYLIFCDGDCIPRDDFVAQHALRARDGWYLAGHRLDIPEVVHSQMTDEDIVSNSVFDVDYLASLDRRLRGCWKRLQRNSPWERLRNLITYRRGVFSGSNASAWREDIVRINGFDENFQTYGSEDRDVGVRLRNLGVRSRYLKFSLVQLHLHHSKPWFDREAAVANRRIFRARRASRVTRVERGLDRVDTDSR